jgi:hypothetical protein
MARKEMVVLYYRNSADARKDCDIIGVDRRRVMNLRRDWQTHATWTPAGMVEVKALIKVSQDTLDSVNLDLLSHIDSESYY